MIDWRRSARADGQFVREREWQTAQSVILWVDDAASMAFSSSDALPQKQARARLLALALGVLLIRGGERVGLTGFSLPPRGGRGQLERLAEALARGAGEFADFGVPEARGMVPQARAVFLSDFLGEIGAVEAALEKAAARGVRGALVMVLDPAEEAFPFEGRTIFESMSGSLLHETLKAGELRARYSARLAARKEALAGFARGAGWRFHVHHTDASAQAALLWLYGALEGAV